MIQKICKIVFSYTMSGVSFVSTNAIIYNMVLPTAYEHINKFMHFIFVFILLMLRNTYIYLCCAHQKLEKKWSNVILQNEFA